MINRRDALKSAKKSITEVELRSKRTGNIDIFRRFMDRKTFENTETIQAAPRKMRLEGSINPEIWENRGPWPGTRYSSLMKESPLAEERSWRTPRRRFDR